MTNMKEITAQEAFEMIRSNSYFGKRYALELVNKEITGERWGYVNNEEIETIIEKNDLSKLSARTFTVNNGSGMEGGVTRHVQIFDEDGHGFEEMWKIAD